MLLRFIGLILTLLCLLGCSNSIRIDDEFTIEYMEMYSSVSLNNGKQGFVGDLDFAFWNNDSLVVSGNKGCFLIELKKTEYNDEMIKIDCSQTRKFLKNKPVSSYYRGQLE